MSDKYVFDTEAIIAYLYKEPGHEIVADLLEQVFSGEANGSLTETNASEVFYLVARFEGTDDTPTDASLRDADRDIRARQLPHPTSLTLTGSLVAGGACQ